MYIDKADEKSTKRECLNTVAVVFIDESFWVLPFPTPRDFLRHLFSKRSNTINIMVVIPDIT